ncbi:nucleotide pyrophosphohydrolase [Candidatus Pacearchaeota archaeon]|jgi:NTP pyrophosphatase (non-canonical NTP hydrolase)|nr:nucleotide pyrophosphohydrolase [Candidatus Pacearchaeota archaeon]
MAEIQELTNYLRGFVAAREWEGYHTPENLAKSISIEAGELLECFQWDCVATDSDKAKAEMADVLIYLIMMADVMGIDLVKAAWAKIASNSARYPVEKAKGNCKKAE